MKKGNGVFDLKYFTTQLEEILEELSQKTVIFTGHDTGNTTTKDL